MTARRDHALGGLAAGRRPHLAALVLGALAAGLLLALAARPGLSRDEAAVLDGAAPALAAGVEAAAGAAAGLLGELRAARLPAALAGGALTALLAVLGAALAGRGALLLAPLLFWLAPRHVQAGLTATPDLAAAALALATAWAYRRAAAARGRRERLQAALAAGGLFGAALALRADAWLLLAALAAHAALLRLSGGRGAGAAGARGVAADRTAEGVDAPGEPEPRVHGVPLAVAAMALAGPALLAAATPALFADPAGALAALAAGQRRDAGALGPVLALGLTVPGALLLAYAAGLAHAAARAVRAFRARAAAAVLTDDLLLALVPAAWIAAGEAGLGAPGPGVSPWLPALPFLALSGARALLFAAALAWPARRRALATVLAAAVLVPGALAVWRAWPHGGAAWNELAGGAPGAAARGLPRQHGGEAVLALAPELGARAAAGAKVWWPGTPASAVARYVREGRLRADLVPVDGPDEADLVVVALDGGPRDAEYRAWAALRTDRPAAGVYVDEVPLAFVYARAGAWR